MLWFRLVFGLKLCKPPNKIFIFSLILIMMHNDETNENQMETGLKNFNQKQI